MRQADISPSEGQSNQAGDSATGSRSRARRSAAPEHSRLAEKWIAGVPARIMRPRIVFIVCLIALVSFGLLMVYSASAVESLKENGDALHYFKNQLLVTAIGVICLLLIVFKVINWDFATGGFANASWVVLVLLLAAVFVIGSGAGGAKRWIGNESISFQPSEFMKPVLIVCVARLLQEYYELHSLDTQGFLVRLAVGVVLPAGLIVFEPDTGTTIIIILTILVMVYLSGLSYKVLVAILLALLLVLGIMVLATPYRMARFNVFKDPWDDMYDSGYQATLALMAFSSGGLFGRGIGNSTMKYSYLPEAHNDFILAVIGEELGFVGTAIFFIVFATLVVCGFKIAWQSPTLRGRMIAAGCSFILGLQFLVNALGVLGVTPMTGKTMPFVSYGGSSMISCLILAALIIRVSVESNPRTVYDARRERFSVMNDQDVVSDHLGRSTAGAVRVRGSRQTAEDTGFSVYDGGPTAAPGSNAEPRTTRRERGSVPLSQNSFAGRSSDSGRESYQRINLNDNAADRLRERGPQVRRF